MLTLNELENGIENSLCKRAPKSTINQWFFKARLQEKCKQAMYKKRSIHVHLLSLTNCNITSLIEIIRK